jgi:hypothetical protein
MRRKEQSSNNVYSAWLSSPVDKTPPPASRYIGTGSPHRGGEAMRRKEQSSNNVYSAWLSPLLWRGAGGEVWMERDQGNVFSLRFPRLCV